MIYAAFFSFFQNSDEPRNGDFTCLVEAPNAETAAERLHSLIKNSVESDEAFSENTDIYLDQLTEVGKLPKDGVIAHYRSVAGEPEPTLYGSLVFPKKLTGWAIYSPTDADDEDTSLDPFFRVLPKKTKSKAAAKAKAVTKPKATTKPKPAAKAKAKATTKPKAAAPAKTKTGKATKR